MTTNERRAVPGGEVIVYESPEGEGSVDVRFEDESVWLTQLQMAEVFQSTPENILMHLRNIFSSKELDAVATTKDFLVVRSEGKRSVRRKIRHYNLDAIISIGYRVNSKRAVRFRQWATRTLREHLVSGYALNERRLAERGLDETKQTLELLARTLKNQALVDETGRAVLHIITAYADTWRLLLEYDEDRLKTPASAKPATSVLELDSACNAIDALRRDLAAKGEASPLFGRPGGGPHGCRTRLLPSQPQPLRKERSSWGEDGGAVQAASAQII